MEERRLLALDFDGVVWDSVRECYEVAKAACAEVGMPPCELSYERFYAGRWLVRAGRDFGLLMRLLAEEKELNPQELTPAQFAAFGEQHEEFVERFGECFGRIRSEYRLERPEYWYGLQAPFAAVLRALPLWRERFVDVVVATTKDNASTRALLNSAGLDLPVYGLEHGTDKSRHMQLLIDKYQVKADNVYFIDDLLVNLQDAAKAGIRGYLAAWGYNTPQSRAAAERAGFALLREEDLPSLGL